MGLFMRVLVTGSGGRGHAIARRIAQYGAGEKGFVAPGESGSELVAKLQNVEN